MTRGGRRFRTFPLVETTKPLEIPQETFTLREIAKRLSVAETTPRSWVRDRKLRAFIVGGRYRITRADLEDFLRRSQRGVRS